MAAAFEGNKEIVQLLLEHGADVQSETREGWTALKSAELGGHKSIVKLLS